jgi:glycopeptide antibiotics resistance protein
MFRQHPLLSAVTFAYLGVVGWLTLGPQPDVNVGDGLFWQLLAFFQRHESTAWIDYATLEFSANVAMFAPIGLFLLLLLGRRRWWAAILFGVLLTAGIEFVQQFLPGRVSDPRDVAANSVGAAVGVVVALVVTWPAAVRRARETRRMRARTA